MKTGFDIHNYERQLKSAERIVNESNLRQKNKEVIFQFRDFCILKGYSVPRILKYFEILRVFAKQINKDFDKATKQDVEKYVLELHSKPLSPWTKLTHRAILKRFYKWINGDKVYPECVEWVCSNIKRSEKKMLSNSELLTEKEVKKLIETSDNLRDKAFVSTLYESGCRVGELASLQMKNVSFDTKGLVMTVEGKTGSRKIRLVASSGLLASWINVHPLNKDIEAPLWVNIGTTNKNKMMNYSGIRMMLKKLFERAEIKKKFNPHLFRHSRATLMANHLTEFQMNQYFGWIQGSDMPSTYVHLTGKNLDGAILSMNGIEEPVEKKESTMKPLICSRCNKLNSIGDLYCSICTAPLTKEKIIEQQANVENEEMTERILTAIQNLPEVKEILKGKILKI